MEDGALETEALLARAQSPEVLRRFGNDVSEQLHDDSPDGLAVDRHVEVHHRVGVSRKRLGHGHLSAVGPRHEALAVDERSSEGLGHLWSLELGRELLDLPVSLCLWETHT